MTRRLLLDEHYSADIASALTELGHDVLAVVAIPDLRGASDPEVFAWAAADARRIVTENVRDFRPLLTRALAYGEPSAPVLLVPPRRFPRGRGDRSAVIVAALAEWLDAAAHAPTSSEDWLR